MKKSSQLDISKEEWDLFTKDLLFLNMRELRELCRRFSITHATKKEQIIEQIKQYIEHGQVSEAKSPPAQSRAKKGEIPPLKPESLMLFGAYRNDLKTRLFMKELVGPHFHFTAYGIDWLEERWQQGKPPTYAEFARYWQEERGQRAQVKAEPKKEWAYINFLQRYRRRHPTANKSEMLKAWEKERRESVERVMRKIERFFL